jgi:DNA-binding transcriptional MocR family regulator
MKSEHYDHLYIGLLAPGERLPGSRRIAEALGVGEITVRRALVSLWEAGLLERRPASSAHGLGAAPPPGRGPPPPQRSGQRMGTAAV